MHVYTERERHRERPRKSEWLIQSQEQPNGGLGWKQNTVPWCFHYIARLRSTVHFEGHLRGSGS